MAEVFHRYLGKDGKMPKLSAQERKEAARRNKLATELTDERTAAVRVNRMRAEMLLARARNELIEKRLALLQVSYLLTVFRQRVLTEPSKLARRLVDGGFVAEECRTEVQEMIKHDLHAMLKDPANLPSQIADPNWIKKIDSDLREQVEGDA
jgi:hypothetical protein